MALMEMIEKVGGEAALQQIGARVGLSPNQIQSAITSLAPVLAPKIAQHADEGGLAQTPAASAPPAPGSDPASDHGNDVLRSIFGSKDVSRLVATDASAQTGIGVDKIKAVPPQLASIAAVAFLAHRAAAQGGGGLGGISKAWKRGSESADPITRASRLDRDNARLDRRALMSPVLTCWQKMTVAVGQGATFRCGFLSVGLADTRRFRPFGGRFGPR